MTRRRVTFNELSDYFYFLPPFFKPEAALIAVSVDTEAETAKDPNF